MPYVPDPAETKRLRAALDRAAFSEGERILWLLAFSALAALDGILLATARTWTAAGIGLLGALGGFMLLYWRLRAGHLSNIDPKLHGVGLGSRMQRAFTALMLRQVFTGRNPLRPRVDHDPFATWGAKVERAQVSEEA